MGSWRTTNAHALAVLAVLATSSAGGSGWSLVAEQEQGTGLATPLPHPGGARSAVSIASPELWSWVRARMGIEGAPPPPMVEVVSEDRVLRLLGRGDEPGAGVLEVLAVYDRVGARILLRAPVDPTNPVSQSVLVHELVHHAQALLGRVFACPAEAEKEAFRLQQEWLLLAGRDLEADFGIDGLTLLVLTNCSM